MIYWYKMPNIKTTIGRGAEGKLVVDITNMKQFGSYICCILHQNGVSECFPEAKVNMKGKGNIFCHFNSKNTVREENHVYKVFILISMSRMFIKLRIMFMMYILHLH